MKRYDFYGGFLLMALLTWTGCTGSGTKERCVSDADCPDNWVCYVYGNFCRCINDSGCNTDKGERCTPSGICQVNTGCKKDSECGECQRCETELGVCLCADDCACPNGYRCNASGFCQPGPGCFDNDDCSSGEMCDTPSKTCIPATACRHNFHCSFGQICRNGICQDGCEDHGDCPWIDDVKFACINGTCTAGVCGDDSFCNLLEKCLDGDCVPDGSMLCQPCKASVRLDSCGDLRNTCLVYPFKGDAYDLSYPEEWRSHPDAMSAYCGLDCSADESVCPNGFSCRNVIRVTMLCSTDAQCPGDIPCIKRLESDEGHCPCHPTLLPCPSNVCLRNSLCEQGECMWDGRPMNLSCSTDAECRICSAAPRLCNSNDDCPAIVCDPYEGVDYGACVISASCGLDQGMHCPASR